jgi:hypothetical protein
MHILNWLDPHSGIHDDSLFGLHYVSGTCIVLSKKSVDYLLASEIDYSFIDDVSIGLTLSKFISPNQITDMRNYFTMESNADPKYFIYRHRSENRHEDADNIKKLIETL